MYVITNVLVPRYALTIFDGSARLAKNPKTPKQLKEKVKEFAHKNQYPKYQNHNT